MSNLTKVLDNIENGICEDCECDCMQCTAIEECEMEKDSSNSAKARVQNELDSLTAKYITLDGFISTDAFYELPRVQQTLLHKQLAVMREYKSILQLRLDFWRDNDA